MANQINTRIRLKYDSYENWQEKDPALLSGEIAIAYLGQTRDENGYDNLQQVEFEQHPVLFKVGPGNFNSLPWASALAADVYSWAKKSETEFKAWVKNLIPVEVIDNGTGKFVTDVTVTNDANGHHITITRADVAWTDITGKPDLVNTVKTTDDDVVVLTPTAATNGNVTIDGKHAKKGPTNGYTTTVPTDKSATAFGDSVTIKVPSLTVDAYGHTTKAGDTDYVITLPTPEAAVNTVTTASGVNAIKVTDKATDGNHNYEVSLTLDSTGEEFLSQSANGLKLVGVQTAINNALKEAKDYADDNDANTEYHIEYDSTNKKIKLVAGANTSKMEIDASDFIADGMLSSVTADQTNNKLVFEWNTDAGITKTEIPLSSIADIYTAKTGATQVQLAISNTNEISASLVAGGVGTTELAANAVTTAKIADSNVTEDKIANNAVTTNKIKDSNVTTNKVANGAITEDKLAEAVKTKLNKAAPVGTGTVAIATKNNDGVVTLNGGVKLNDHTLEDDTSKADITLAKVATSGSIYDLNEVKTTDDATITGGDYLIFYCGSAEDVI